VIGIVAGGSRIGITARPSCSREGDGELKGSGGRSPASICAMRSISPPSGARRHTRFGGHAYAAGVTIVESGLALSPQSSSPSRAST
jgi:hypothetical protein